MNRIRAAAVLAALPLATVLVSCQLVAGLDGIKANDARSSGAGGAGAGGASVSNGSGTRGGGGIGGGEGGALAPSCQWLTTFTAVPDTFAGDLLAAAPNDASIFSGLINTSTCQGEPCAYLQRLSAGGAAGKRAVLASTPAASFVVSSVASVPTMDQGVAIAGWVNDGMITLPTGGGAVGPMVGGQVALFVASLSHDLGSTRWYQELLAPNFSDFRVAADPANGAVAVAGKLLGSANAAFNTCQISDSEVFLADLGGEAGQCISINSLQGAGAEAPNVLRTSDEGHALLAGAFTGEVDFPSGQMNEFASVTPAAYYGVFQLSTGVDLWHNKIEDGMVSVTGGSISQKGSHLAIAGTFSGAPPTDLTEPAVFTHCPAVTPPSVAGFVKTYGDAVTMFPTAEIELCLGSMGTTQLDATVDDDGLVTVVGKTTGQVDFGKFHVAGSGEPALFFLQIDSQGNLVFSLANGTSSPQTPVHVLGLSDGPFLAAGFFTGSLDFGGPCQAQAKGTRDAFVAELGP